MEKFVRGDVVVVPFPFSDLTQLKRRPALIIAVLEGNDIILCQITSQKIKDRYAVLISDDDFESGTLKQKSNIRPNRIFTADRKIVLYKIGRLKTDKTQVVIDEIFNLIKG